MHIMFRSANLYYAKFSFSFYCGCYMALYNCSSNVQVTRHTCMLHIHDETIASDPKIAMMHGMLSQLFLY